MAEFATPRHTPWDGSQPLFRIGLAPLDLNNWIEPDEKLASYLQQKEALIANRRDDVFAAQADTLGAQREVHEMLAAHLLQNIPDFWEPGENGVRVIPAGRTVAPDNAYPLLAAARLVQEDLVLLRKKPDGWSVVAGSVCFPSSWRLKDKFGKPMHQVHGPVPDFGAGSRNAEMIERIFDNMKPEVPVWRLNWSLYPDGELFHGDEDRERRRTGELEDIHLRVEHQTLRKLPVSGDILFTIRIHLDPAKLIERHPDRQRLAAGLLNLVSRLTAEQAHYKGINAIRERLVARLQELASS